MKAENVMEVLNYIRAPRANLGYKYTITAMQIMSENEDYISDAGNLYMEIGKREGSTYSRVERAIRHEVEIIFKNTPDDILDKVFGKYRSNGKLTNKEFLSALYYYIYYLVKDEWD